MTDNPAPGPRPQPPCDECAKNGQRHGDPRHGMAAIRASEAEGRTRAAYRRARVLAHPDIAAALTEPPLRYSEPDRWTGHIPPAWLPTRDGWRPNRTPQRAALITICEAVAAREAQNEDDD